ncbi:response regulator [Methylocapsa palsarum]|uniref:Response regulator receiver domain-containing protein n=1 Tax=Methylocapsa palsarum TaxID=1612308 RepID=A0A1I4B141_9HYPH|nr:response regulator [Methylocapsa palsarum]SFK62263.1 Response regulator receiver domain-containing protein [Methylocapsa palsarum]
MEQTKKRALPLVLVVEDEPYVRTASASMLEDAGFEVIEACDADEALRLLSVHPNVGVVFTDVEMPGSLDGLSLARRIHHDWPGIGVVVTSGRYGSSESIQDGDVFMPKPYHSADLISGIEESLRRILTRNEQARRRGPSEQFQNISRR